MSPTLQDRLDALRREVAHPKAPAARPRQGPGRKKRPTGARLSHGQLAARGLAGLALVALPFVLYVRLAVELYQRGAPSWIAIGTAAIVALALVTLYATWLSRRLHGRARAIAATRWIAVPFVAAWCLYSLFYLSQANAKSDAVRSYYTTLHPVLRVALSTIILIDPDLVITDMRREPGDYARMGLPVNDRTKHYEQRTGWVHAVDLRTRDRSEIKNRAVQLYFWSMGFSTLRHVGTADHLHVQLK
jgi:hypothetical protein